MDSSGYVYLICDASNDTFKIGVTRNKDSRRLKKLQTGNSTDLFIMNEFLSRYPFRLEKMLHGYFSNKHEYNEWFRLDSNDVANFGSICAMFEDDIRRLNDNPFFMKNIR